MKKNNFIYSLYAGLFWAISFIFWAVILSFGSKYFENKVLFSINYRLDVLENLTNHVIIFSPFFISVIVSSYFFLESKKKYLYYLISLASYLTILFIIVFLTSYEEWGGELVIFIYSVIVCIYLLLLYLNQIIFSQYKDLSLRIITFKIVNYSSIFHFILLVNLGFNTIIIFLATSTGSSNFCNLGINLLSNAKQTSSGVYNSHKFPDGCLIEMTKAGHSEDICEGIETEKNKDACYLEASLYSKNKKICDRIRTNPPGIYMECLAGKK